MLYALISINKFCLVDVIFTLRFCHNKRAISTRIRAELVALRLTFLSVCRAVVDAARILLSSLLCFIIFMNRLHSENSRCHFECDFRHSNLFNGIIAKDRHQFRPAHILGLKMLKFPSKPTHIPVSSERIAARNAEQFSNALCHDAILHWSVANAHMRHWGSETENGNLGSRAHGTPAPSMPADSKPSNNNNYGNSAILLKGTRRNATFWRWPRCRLYLKSHQNRCGILFFHSTVSSFIFSRFFVILFCAIENFSSTLAWAKILDHSCYGRKGTIHTFVKQHMRM